MITFDFTDPLIIYLVYVFLTVFSISIIIRYKNFIKSYHRIFSVIIFGVLFYAQVIRYIVPLFNNQVSLPLFPSRLAALSILMVLIIPHRRLKGIAFYLSSTSLLPVFVPMGSIEMLAVLDETFFIDHYIGAIFPFYLICVLSYKPVFKDLVMTSLMLLTIMLLFIPLKENFNLGGYFFMHDENIILSLFPQINWYIFAILLSIGLSITYVLYYFIGKYLYVDSE